MPTLNLKTVSAHLNGQNPKYPPWRLHPRLPTSMVKTLSAHLGRKNSKYPPQKSQPKLPTLKVKTFGHLNGQNPKCPP